MRSSAPASSAAAVALALARRGVGVALLEAEPEPGLGASGTNSGILHTGFDSTPGELETELILASARRPRPAARSSLGIPVLRCGALMRPPTIRNATRWRPRQRRPTQRRQRAGERDDGALEIPGESVTDPVAYTLALAAEAGRQGAELRTRFRVVAIDRDAAGLTVRAEDGGTVLAAS